MNSINEQHYNLAEMFMKHNINGVALLRLSIDDLRNIGINSYGHAMFLFVILSLFFIIQSKKLTF